MNQKSKTLNGNEAAAHISYPFTEVAAIYPITPSSPMAEITDKWAAHGKKNMFGQRVRVVELQSEAGASGTIHGSLAAGALTTTYTASQGLLLMIPNMYKLVGELLPGVFHVSARALATHALSIFGDHQDVMACRQTGFGFLAASNAQEVMDLGCLAHLAAIKSRMPFLHFFDGFRTSHEYQNVNVIDFEDIQDLVDYQAIKEFRARALSPEKPVVRGTAQNPDIYFQGKELPNPYYKAVPEVVENYMQELEKIIGRSYNLFDYHGDPQAKHIIIAMGSVCDTIEETVDHLNEQGRKVGLIKVRLYRPFSAEHLLSAIPDTVKKIAVLDRTKEPGSLGEPLYQDVVHAYKNSQLNPEIIGGRYGLGSKETRPSHIISVFDNLAEDKPKDNFTIGIVDDVSHTSLPETGDVDITPSDTISCKFWGLGSDGTVGANQSAVKIIGDHTDLYAQAYFSYDSKKSGGTTVSHLRFGKQPIRAPYLVYNADYVACHNPAFVNNYDLLQGLKAGGTFVLNCPWSKEDLEEKLPASMKRYLAENDINFYIIDAISIAGEIGLGNRINMIMQSAFFKLADVIPIEDAVKYLKESVVENYGDKGQKVVDMNNLAIDKGIDSLIKVDIPKAWKDAQEEEYEESESEPEFVTNIQKPMAKHEGDDLPVSAFKGMEDGTFPLRTTAYEKRGIAVNIPEWQIDKCIQCNQCSYICPHAVIRPYLLDEEEVQRAPETFETKQATGKDMDDLSYRIQVSPLDCTGCGNCADICPAKGKALIMEPAEEQIEQQEDNWEFAQTITEKTDRVNTKTLKGSQFVKPLFEFHGACPGCGETPYYRLLTQLFGDRMLIANATGCSSIYCASAPSIPFTINSEGRGPAWANSLFEDNAEYGYGMYLASDYIQDRLAELAREVLETQQGDQDLNQALEEWLHVRKDGEKSKEAAKKLINLLNNRNLDANTTLKHIAEYQDYLIKRSQWLIGGDGWAYDIGFGGLDHVLSTGEDVNTLVMDTEVYSNTGGQSSKATQTAAMAKFASSGKATMKKDLGMMAMSYGYVYVAQVSMGANMNQTLKAFLEAEQYPGPSLIIAYSPCINHGIRSGMGTSISQEKAAVDSGYWHLYRYNPQLKEEGKNPFILDSKEPKESLQDFLMSEVRFASLQKVFPETAEKLFEKAKQDARTKYETYKTLSEHKLF
ncbi:pyruvate:ferredoxin (flavodoxin) oxidoreductase [Natranaerobius thermophilus]|uniref:Pyruvate:ferredoxin oxidoreductase n=1 Tax=Natranaerobius thermophilus (strain ATCC BAA-1301 / DSM 18059 / JW/NM-WN-LF) TaxID=457570 RepID=B2A149_NATTJ|nr:pyruvate:ferredoxin (flavodoxin) oxidoreductase [Natranaerobius thermophilus]ACB84672.1 pyruvate flavodoxin/ferredoxin oxidoreductase domain protein [Natranaerobius thermophilus JW/NM-WN-LF]